ncbi:conserved oligomeric Golgi complex subunit 7-like isoform X2 [Dinothrombium tinctorium]|uniref:Conserved oligomeric Golgi complex subunit 7 n=1 Tax=Dinothrombium tinctorium TaxID=1965070 RepID=A0A3S3PJZ4_9ACAR|nr:conserved oligomeric Golgi complex subunit 7-like isoform X2 [Dinothrombium tinctorium]
MVSKNERNLLKENFISQDFKAFSDENFDVIKWINDCFRDDNAAIANRESHASNIVYKLQLFVQEINSSLEETAQQVIHNLSKTTREVETLQEEAALMKSEISKMKEGLIKIEQSSNKAMDNLIAIDKIKTRMQDNCKALQEVDNWSTLSSDVEQIFDSADAEQIVTKLVGMQTSLDMLMDVPDYAERVERLDRLKDRFESLIASRVQSIFSNSSSEVAIVYVQMFKQLKRMSNLINLYSNTIKNQLISEWQKCSVIDPEETIELLNGFYDNLLSTWHSQSTFCYNVMFNGDIEDVFSILTDLFVDIFRTVEPSITHYLCNEFEARKNSGHLKSCLDFLVEVKQITDRFAKSLELTIINEAKGSEFVKKPQVEIMVLQIYAAYRNVLQLYPDVEETILSQECDKIVEEMQLNESVSRIFNVAREAEKRCYLLTHSTAIPNLVSVLEKFFKSYLQHFSQRLKEIDIQCRKETDISLPNWTLFQNSLFHLQAAGDFMLQLNLFQEQLRNTCVELSTKLTSGTSIFQRFYDLAIDTSMKDALKELLAKLNKTENEFILQSSYIRCKNLCSEATEVVLTVALNYVKMHMKNIQSLDDSEEMQPFGPSPQEYITQIGQYLLTIPQHIEPFTLQENSAFKLALKCSGVSDSAVEVVTEFLLTAIVQKVIDLYIKMILNQKVVNPHFKQQLMTDIDYLCEVFDDLGLGPDSQLQDILYVLKSSNKQTEHVVKHEYLAKEIEKIFQ